MTTEPLSCKEFVELVTDYFEDALPGEERQRFEAHLSLCRGCDTYLRQMEQTIRLAGKLSEDSIDPEAQRVLLSAFNGWKRGKKT